MARSAPSSLVSRLLWSPLALLCAVGAAGADGASPGDGYPLVAQALQARNRLVFMARQDILWTTAPDGSGGLVQIVTDIARAGRRARMTYRFPPAAAGRVMVDDGVRTSLYDPARRLLLVGQTLSEDAVAASSMLTLLRRNYRCLRLRRETVNSCPCDVVALRPCGRAGCSKTLWIDRARHAILRTEEYDGGGCRRYVSAYETIRFVPRLRPDTLALPPAAGGAAQQQITVRPVGPGSVGQAFGLAGVPGRLPAWLPRGYVLLRCAVVRTGQASPAVMLRYGDGLKTLTVYEDVNDSPPAAPDGAADRSLARWGQQSWTRRDGRIRAVVRGDLSLSPALGAEMVNALAPSAAAGLQRAAGQDFGASGANQAVTLRRRGWGYEQIAALCLLQKERPQARGRVRALLGRGQAWPEIAAAVGANADSLEERARTWVVSSLACGQKNGETK